MKLIRVFPRRTVATPTDATARYGPPGLFDEADEVHVSVTFTWDLPMAERLAKQWKQVAPVKVGGPACGSWGEEFVPGQYIKHGYVITSRGCPNRCWFCSVWRRDGQKVRELPIRNGWNLLDDNILACSKGHVHAVFNMLKRQEIRPQLTGGLEAARLEDWHVDLLADLNPKQFFFAYDTPDDLEPLQRASKKLYAAGFKPSSKQARCYVLVGFVGDTQKKAEERLIETWSLGFWPMAMLWRNRGGQANIEWTQFQRTWARPAATWAHLRSLGLVNVP